MFAPSPLRRNREAAFRDLSSTTADTRAAAARDVVRHALAGGVGDTEDAALRERAITALTKMLEDGAPLVRSAAVLGLGELEATSALPKLLLRVEDDDVRVREMALTAIGELGDARALPRLRRALSDERPEVRYQSVIAISRIAEMDEVVEALTGRLDDADESVRYITLRVVEERLLQECRDAHDDTREQKQRQFEPLLRGARGLLTASAPRLVAAATILLARAGDDAARGPVLRIVEGTITCDKEDEREGVELAGELGLKEAIPALERRAYGAKRLLRDTCAFHATIALARLGHPRARQDIERDLASRRGDRRAAGVVAAGRARMQDARAVIAAFTDADVDPTLRHEALSLLSSRSHDVTAKVPS